jgi:hypothetical protein
MATIERELPSSIIREDTELPVFAAADDRRARKLRRAVLAAAGLACLWLGGLAIGMVGLDSLPRATVGVLDRIADVRRDAPDRSRGERPRATPASRAPAAAAVADRALAAAAASRTGRRPSAVRRSAHRPPVRRQPVQQPPPAAVPPPPAAPQPPATPAPRQGWAQRGLTVPPGQTSKTETTPPPPPGERGRRVGQQPTTTTAPPPPPGNGQNPKK